jgi:hypothetical protein
VIVIEPHLLISETSLFVVWNAKAVGSDRIHVLFAEFLPAEFGEPKPWLAVHIPSAPFGGHISLEIAVGSRITSFTRALVSSL